MQTTRFLPSASPTPTNSQRQITQDTTQSPAAPRLRVLGRLETNGRFHLVYRPNEGVRSSQLVVPSCDVGKAKLSTANPKLDPGPIHISSCVKVNGFSSDTFQITRGVRQGCPLSPILYVIFSEALNKCILKDDEIRGPPELGGRPLLLQFRRHMRWRNRTAVRFCNISIIRPLREGIRGKNKPRQVKPVRCVCCRPHRD